MTHALQVKVARTLLVVRLDRADVVRCALGQLRDELVDGRAVLSGDLRGD